MEHRESQMNQVLPATFVGLFDHSLDPKKRLTIPSVWRQIIGEPQEVFIVPSLERPCLNGFRRRELDELVENLLEQAETRREARDIKSFLGSRSEHLLIDSQGRIRIKDETLAHVGISTQVRLTGGLDRFEIWQPDAQREKEQSLIEEMGSKLKGYDSF